MDNSATGPVEAYIEGFPKGAGKAMREITHTIREGAPGATEDLSWGVPTFRLGKIVVQFAGYKHHIGFYPYPETIDHFRIRLTGYKTSKGGVPFPYNKPVPLDIVRDMTLYNVAKIGRKA